TGLTPTTRRGASGRAAAGAGAACRPYARSGTTRPAPRTPRLRTSSAERASRCERELARASARRTNRRESGARIGPAPTLRNATFAPAIFASADHFHSVYGKPHGPP